MSALGKRDFGGNTRNRSMATQTHEEKTAGHEETGVDPIQRGWHIFRGPPSYTHAVLPYIYERRYDLKSQNSYDIAFRLTSPYDPFIESDRIDQNIGVGTEWTHQIRTGENEGRNIESFSTAYWKFYESMYKYYSVIACRYKISVENLSNDRCYVHKMFINFDRPDPHASNWDMQIWPGVESHVLHPQIIWSNGGRVLMNEVSTVQSDGLNADIPDNIPDDAANQNNQGSYVKNMTGSSWAHFQGEYRPGDHERDVILDEAVEIFTPVNRNPTLREAIFLRLKQYDNSSVPRGGQFNENTNRNMSFVVRCEIEYLTEFKELKAGLKWPTNRNPATVSISDATGMIS